MLHACGHDAHTCTCADLEAVQCVGALTEAGASLYVLTGVHDVVPEIHGKALLRLHQREHLHRHLCLVQRRRPRNNQLPVRQRSSTQIWRYSELPKGIPSPNPLQMNDPREIYTGHYKQYQHCKTFARLNAEYWEYETCRCALQF